jgi:hypothetical protein
MAGSFIHVLNGDSLHEQFPVDLTGATLIFNECLIEGPKDAAALEVFFEFRQDYLSHTYGSSIKDTYRTDLVVPLWNIEMNSGELEIVLWFEEDLFCQTNFWFVCHFLKICEFQGRVSWAKPFGAAKYSFGRLSQESLRTVFKERLPVDLSKIASLWRAYSKDDSNKLISLVESFSDLGEYILPAAIAFKDMNSSSIEQSRPYLSLIEIMRTLKTLNFGEVFVEFCQKEAVYGLGDLQVKRLFDEVIKKNQGFI